MECTEATPQLLYDEWAAVFSAANVAAAQHYVTALSSAFDDIYTRYHGVTTARTAIASDASGNGSFDADLPSHMCLAVKHSLDSWLAAIKWLNASGSQTKDDPPLQGEFFRRMRLALIEQSDVWLALLTCRQHLGGFTVETVMNRLVRDITAEFETAIKRSLRQNAIHKLGSAGLLTLAVAVILLAPVTIWLLLAKPDWHTVNANGLWAVLSIGGIGPVIAALFGLRALGSPAASAATAGMPTGSGTTAGSNTLLAGVGGVMGAITVAAREAFDRAYTQIRNELAALNHNIGVTYPLIECYVMCNDTLSLKMIQDDYSFMTQVIWTTDERRDEIEDVVRAALGPTAMAIGARISSERRKQNSP